MQRRTRIIISVALLAILVAFLWARSLLQYQERSRRGRVIAVGLNAQFLVDPRFNKVRVLGYTGHAAMPWTEGIFQVTGSVPTRKDFADLVGIVRAVSPPGKLSFRVALTAPAPAPRPRTR
ncbi:MAG: hypothetical protein JWR69_3817 [Pedosphaera sp.]|nr:hypothetical protein [Pedosphaera sp.]